MTGLDELSPPYRDRAAVDDAVRRLRLANAQPWDTSDQAAERVLAWLRKDQKAQEPSERLWADSLRGS